VEGVLLYLGCVSFWKDRISPLSVIEVAFPRTSALFSDTIYSFRRHCFSCPFFSTGVIPLYDGRYGFR
jgi:hypothetical protein